jgi:prolyl-tRNA editing enzyme YbaK/EbsC (Cys-tRNA(Pro) deacylase)
MASGGRRVDPALVAKALGEPVGKADADFVRARTGFAIGGVAPVGHTAPPAAVLIDAELLAWPEIWAAAGHSHTVFRLTPDDLVRMTGGKVATLR